MNAPFLSQHYKPALQWGVEVSGQIKCRLWPVPQAVRGTVTLWMWGLSFQKGSKVGQNLFSPDPLFCEDGSLRSEEGRMGRLMVTEDLFVPGLVLSISTNSTSSTKFWVRVLPLLQRWGNWGSERLYNHQSRARMDTQEYHMQSFFLRGLSKRNSWC
jgi:hypothetical protein